MIALCSLVLSIGCGGQTTGPEDPSGDPEVGTEQPPTEDAKPSDGIVRDADGDGVPDAEGGSGCEGKTETQCKINMACAWSDDGKCVKASSSPM